MAGPTLRFQLLIVTLFTVPACSTLRAHAARKQKALADIDTVGTCTIDSDCSFPRGVCVDSSNGKNKKCMCRSPYAGSACKETETQLLCEPHCENKGFCDVSTKTCQCPTGYVGNVCQIKCPMDEKGFVCGGHGDCSLTKKLGAECFCTPGWTGDTCSRKICPITAQGECSNSGKCVKGACECLDTFAGKACSERVCNIDCNGHGTCTLATQTCTCKEGWFGKNCELKVCPSTRFGVCGGRGMCDETTGVCSCDESFSGGACHIPRCVAGTSVDCSGHGRCRGEKCHCALGWAGEACQKQVCPMGCLSSAGRGNCVGGACECTPGFMGEACESKEPVPLACGAPCQNKCMQLPLADDSVKHCEQIRPIDISLDGTFPVSTTEDGMEPQNNNFPGFKCYQMCISKCIQGCFDQMHPMRAAHTK